MTLFDLAPGPLLHPKSNAVVPLCQEPRRERTRPDRLQLKARPWRTGERRWGPSWGGVLFPRAALLPGLPLP